MPTPGSNGRLENVLKMLALVPGPTAPARVRIIFELDVKTPAQIAKELGVQQSALSPHLRVLSKAQLIEPKVREKGGPPVKGRYALTKLGEQLRDRLSNLAEIMTEIEAAEKRQEYTELAQRTIDETLRNVRGGPDLTPLVKRELEAAAKRIVEGAKKN